MRARWIAPIAALLALACRGAAEDSAPRRILQVEALGPYAAVGRVNVAGESFCTGALIAPDIVLTAAHCTFHPTSGRRLEPGRLHFVAGWTRDAWVGHSPVAAVALPEGFDLAAGPGEAGDLAMLRLARPIAEAEPFETGTAAPGAPLGLASYGRGRAWALSVQDRCRHRGYSGDLLAVTCAAAPGSSGAPVFADGRIVAVVSALRRGSNGTTTLATELARSDLDRLRARLQRRGP